MTDPVPKGPNAEFIDSTDPEWEPYLGASHDLSGVAENGVVVNGVIRFDSEDGNFTIIVNGGSVNFMAEQRPAFKTAITTALAGWPTPMAKVDLGHNSACGLVMGQRVPVSVDLGDGDDEFEPLFIIRSAGLVRMTKDQTMKLQAVL